jgi:hypothetical protein
MNETSTITVDFTKREALTGLPRHGWSAPEPHGSWTDGNGASIGIAALNPRCDYVCEIYLTPFLAPPILNEQEIIIKISGAEVLRETISLGGTLRFRVPYEAIGHDGKLDLSFWFKRAMAPSSLGINVDSRRLSFSFSYINFTQAADRPVSRGVRTTAGSHLPAAPSAGPASRPPSGKKKIAAVTMVYNEPEYLPIWLRHYGRHVGPENCFVIDHGSDDGSTQGLSGCNVVRIPRSSYDPHLQSTFNSKFCSSLLCWYEWVLYSDVDEIILPDPNTATTLAEYCDLSIPDIVTAIGMNVQHVPSLEGTIDITYPVTLQRSWVFPSSSMCKPLLINRDVCWPGGSHSADAALAFHELYAFHLRWFDLDSSVRRLMKTRTMAWAALDRGGDHARVTDESWLEQFNAFADMPREEPSNFGPSSAPLKPFLDAVVASQRGREFDIYKIDLNIWGNRLWKLPARFVGTF